MTSGTGPRLTLRVTEQPAKLHRFRYLREIKDGRMGSILHGRSSQKTPVKVEVTADVNNTCPMKLACCAVFDDLATHPFYLFGEACSGGVFEKEFSLASADGYKCEVSLDRIGIVATSKKQSDSAPKLSTIAASTGAETQQDDSTSNYEDRISRWNFFNKPTVTHPFRRDVNKLKLAFQVFVLLPDSEQLWTPANCTAVATELILNAKMHSKLTVDCVIPKVVLQRDQNVWLYMKDPLPDGAWLTGSAGRFTVKVESRQGQAIADLPVNSLKKHLVVFDFTNVKLPNALEIAAVRVADTETGHESEPVNLELMFTSAEQEPAHKRSKREGTIEIEALVDMVDMFYGREIHGDEDLFV